MGLHFDVFTLFPQMFPGVLGESVVGKALSSGLWSLNTVNIRDFAKDRHKTVDDAPFGGGAGMVMRPDVINGAFESLYSNHQDMDKLPNAFIYLSPRGKKLDQSRIKSLAKMNKIGLLCGRFEGIDQRVIDHWSLEEVSLGDYILSGGELAAMVLIDACTRLVPGVLGSCESTDEESFSSDLLEYPHFTRPQVWNGMAVPDVLISGHHEKVRRWRQSESERLTQIRRPDLWERYRLNMQPISVDNACEKADD